jgi:hypothetical protein
MSKPHIFLSTRFGKRRWIATQSWTARGLDPRFPLAKAWVNDRNKVEGRA